MQVYLQLPNMADPIPLFFQSLWSLQFLGWVPVTFPVWAHSCFSASSAAGNSRSRHGALEPGALIIVSTQGFPVQTSETAFPILAGLCLPAWMCFARLNPLPCLLLSLFVKTWPCNETNLNTLYWDKPSLYDYSPGSASAARCRSKPLFFLCSWLIKKDQFSALAARESLECHCTLCLCFAWGLSVDKLRCIWGAAEIPVLKTFAVQPQQKLRYQEFFSPFSQSCPIPTHCDFCLFNHSFS